MASESGAGTRARLLPITGRDELAVALAAHGGAERGGARALLSSLVRTEPGGAPVDTAALTVSDADRLLAALHQLLYGDEAECRVGCAACDEPFEFTVVLSELLRAQDAARGEPPGPDGTWSMPNGSRLRPPRLGDVEAADSPASLVESLTVTGDPVDPATAGTFLEKSAPVLALDLDARCPHCGAASAVRFDMSRYLAARLGGERAFLLREAHLIASRYGWSHDEIMSLTRDERRAYAGHIEAERLAVRTKASR